MFDNNQNQILYLILLLILLLTGGCPDDPKKGLDNGPSIESAHAAPIDVAASLGAE